MFKLVFIYRKRKKTFIVGIASWQKKRNETFLSAPSSFSFSSHLDTVSNRDVSSLGYLSLLPKWLYGDYTFIRPRLLENVTTPRGKPVKEIFANRLIVSVNFSHPVRNNFISTAFSILNLRFSRDLKVPLEFPRNKILFLDRIRNDYIRFIYLFISFPPPATRELEILDDVEPASPCHESRAIETRHLSPLSLSLLRERFESGIFLGRGRWFSPLAHGRIVSHRLSKWLYRIRGALSSRH